MSSRVDARVAPGAEATASERYEVTRNPCVVCSPLGAAIAFAGVERGMTLLHGSQGCATYIRRYAISHFREPLDVASSSFTEDSAVFGGADKLRLALANVIGEYHPDFVGVATTCLAETIGEDAASVRRALGAGAIREAAIDDDASRGVSRPLVVAVSTPSYRGSHREGFRAALRALTEATNPAAESQNAAADAPGGTVGSPKMAAGVRSEAAGFRRKPLAVFPALISPADLRSLRNAIESFGLEAIFATDYSDTLDGGPWAEHRLLPEGGTPVDDLRRMGSAAASIELGFEIPPELSAATYLEESRGVPRVSLGLPVGLTATDAFIDAVSGLSGRSPPRSMRAERARLLDSYADAHKHVFGKRALLYGDPDIAKAIALFLEEIGMIAVFPEGEGRDFSQVESAARASTAAGTPIDLAIGSGKGYKTAVSLNVPLIRVGFPIHDRFGGQRVRLLGYGGTQELFDRIVNALIERRQDESTVGYTYY